MSLLSSLCLAHMHEVGVEGRVGDTNLQIPVLVASIRSSSPRGPLDCWETLMWSSDP